MFIEIFQSIPHYWYNKHIGETFEVTTIEEEPEDFVITEGEHTGKHILKSDCREIITLGRLSA